jgi:cytochrome c553
MSHPDTARRTAGIRRVFVFLGLACAAGAALAQSTGDPARGEARSAACSACHGAADRAPLPLTPSLAGQQEEFLVLQMFLLREGLREVPQMAGLFSGFSDRDLTDVAAYFARQTPPRSNSKPDPQLHARGAGLAKAMGCGSCHVQDYRGQKQVPRLASLQEDYLVATMKAYRDNKRTGADTSMNAVLYQVPDGDIQALAHFLANVSYK